MAILAIILTVLFVTFKIFHIIAWSWWLVFLPAIIVFGTPIGIAGGLLIVGAIATTLLAIFDKPKKRVR